MGQRNGLIECLKDKFIFSSSSTSPPIFCFFNMGDTGRCVNWWEYSSREGETDEVEKRNNSRDRFLKKAKVKALTFE